MIESLRDCLLTAFQYFTTSWRGNTIKLYKELLKRIFIVSQHFLRCSWVESKFSFPGKTRWWARDKTSQLQLALVDAFKFLRLFQAQFLWWMAWNRKVFPGTLQTDSIKIPFAVFQRRFLLNNWTSKLRCFAIEDSFKVATHSTGLESFFVDSKDIN